MKPTISLGEGVAPELEFSSSGINSIVALAIEEYSPLSSKDRDSALSFLSLDTLFLDEETNSFYQLLEAVCKRIISGELVRYDVDKFQMSEYGIYLRPETVTGEVGGDVMDAAKKYLTFLASHPDYWPLKGN